MKAPEMNGNRFVAIDFMCKKCNEQKGKQRRMARIGMDTFPGADVGLWCESFGGPTSPDVKAGKVLLSCPAESCRHEPYPHPHVDDIVGWLAAVPRDTNGYGVSCSYL